MYSSTLSLTSALDGDCGPGSSVDIATDYGLDGPGSNPSGDEIFRPSRPALGPTQPPVKWVRGVLLTAHPLLVPRSWKSRGQTGPVTGTLYLYLYLLLDGDWWPAPRPDRFTHAKRFMIQ